MADVSSGPTGAVPGLATMIAALESLVQRQRRVTRVPPEPEPKPPPARVARSSDGSAVRLRAAMFPTVSVLPQVVKGV